MGTTSIEPIFQQLSLPIASQRLPRAAAASILTAFIALFITSDGQPFIIVLICALSATYLTEARLERGTIVAWLIRMLLYSAAGFLYLYRPLRITDAVVERGALLIGQICAAELALRCWERRTRGLDTALIPLSILVFWAASATIPGTHIRFFAPLYILFLTLSLPAYRSRTASVLSRSGEGLAYVQGQRIAVRLFWAAMALVIGIGAGLHYGVYTYRYELTNLSARILTDSSSGHNVALSTSPFLTSTFGQGGSSERVLRLRNYAGDSHLRVMAYDTYARGAWLPILERRNFSSVTPESLKPQAAGHHAQVTRLITKDAYLFAPLNMAGCVVNGFGDLDWDAEREGPVRTTEEAIANGASDLQTYELIVNDKQDYQGPLCVPPTEIQRKRLLAVPLDISPGVKALAQNITHGISEPGKRVEAITDYLLSHYKYSLTVYPGSGDPVSNFLLNNLSAHCEYFASSAAILLRCAGVPSRYVIGYYAHENEGADVTVVRFHDAHAWAECWIDGRGWVTVDATPGDGRPDQTAPKTPIWTRLIEQVRDRIDALRTRLANLEGKAIAVVVIGVSSVALVGYLLVQMRRRAGTASPNHAYSDAGIEMAALSSRFEQLLQQWGIPSSPGQTWRDHLTLVAKRAQLEESVKPPRGDLERAMAFVRAYNRARFGLHRDSNTISTLSDQLRELEKIKRK